MIVRCTYEELTALKHGARAVLHDQALEEGAVAAPPREVEGVVALRARLVGDFTVETLADNRRLTEAVETIVECLRVEMEIMVSVTHPADEDAVAAYFGFAHAFSVLSRLRQVSSEMEALIGLVTGERPTEEVAATFRFPD